MSKSNATIRRDAESRSTTARHATAEGTARWRDRFTSSASSSHGAQFYRPLADGVLASSIGIGTYLGDCVDGDDEATMAAIRASLERGVNLIDTAINYRCQRAEQCVGRAVRAAIADGVIARDEIVVCTKGGYLPLDGSAPASREAYLDYVRETYVATGVLSEANVVGNAHALSPSFLDDQIERSLANLGLDAVDVYYLHNPEQQLETVQPARFRTLMKYAFAALEAQVAAGRIRAYGVATWNGTRVPSEAKGHLSLHELMSIARDAGGEGHHFSVVQMPINLAMPEALRVATQRLGGKRTATPLAAAVELGLSVVASAALMQGRLANDLPADVSAAMREVYPALETDAQRSIAFVRGLPGVTTALVGMKRVEHVAENLAVS